MTRRVNKSELIKQHLIYEGKSLTSLDAIQLYGVTRLAAVIHVLRKEGYDIITRDTQRRDRYGNDCNIAEYVYVQKGQPTLF